MSKELNRKKIIHVMDELCWGGVNSFVRDLCQELRVLGYEVYVIIIMDPDNSFSELVQKLGYDGVIIQTLGAKNKKQALSRYIPVLRKRICEISGGDMAICNLHLRLSTLMGALATIGLKNIRCVETYHSAYRAYTLQNIMLRHLIDMYVPCSESAGKEMKERFHLSEKRMTIIPNGVSRSSLKHAMGEVCAHKAHLITILSVGRFSNQKNFTVSVEAFSKTCCEDLVYKIIGDGEERTKIVEAAGGNKYIEFLGSLARKEVLNELAKADIVVMPSLWEGLSIFMLESMAFDNPMIISEADSLISVFEEQKLKEGELFRICKWGYICQTSTPAAYEAALKHFINHKELWESMRSEIRFFSEKYDIKEAAKKYSELYKKLIID